MASPFPCPVGLSGFNASFLISFVVTLPFELKERTLEAGSCAVGFDGEANWGRGTENMSLV